MNNTLKIFLTLTLLSYLPTFTSGQVIDHASTAAHYFGNDSKWYLENIPFFECSDSKIQDVYYYRWKLYKAHIRDIGSDRFVITEFLDNVTWDKEPYSSLNDATCFHIYEGRWLKDNKYVKGYIDYLYAGGGNDRHFSEAIAEASYANYLVDADSTFITKQLGIMQHIFNLWLDHYDLSKKLYFIQPILDATEYTISSVDASGGKDGFFGGDAFRPTINSYMYGNAQAISQIAKVKGDTALCKKYNTIANNLKSTFQNSLWNDSLNYFTDRYKVNNEFVHYWDFIRGRELAGIVPWCYNLPDNTTKYNAAWNCVLDTTKLLGKYGLRTTEPSYEYYMKQYRYLGPKRECQWNGPSWPYQTTQTLEAMANLLNNYTQSSVSNSDYLKILRLYTQQHYLTDNYLDLEEDYDPDNGGPIVGLDRSHHYNHSGYDDLIITGLCGIRPSKGNTLTINPLIDSTINYFCLDDVTYHGHKLTIVYDKNGDKYKVGKGLNVYVDNKKVSVRNNNGKYIIALGSPVVKEYSSTKNLALNILYSGYPKPSASANTTPDSLFQAIDGRCWYFNEIQNWWSTNGSDSKTDWYALDFGKKKKVSSVTICFHCDENKFSVPDTFTVEYWNGDSWIKAQKAIKDVKENGPNTIKLDRIETSKIRIMMNHKKKDVAITEVIVG